MNRVYIGIGSNLNPERNCVLAIKALKELDPQLSLSEAYQSEAVGYQGPDFINLVAELNVSMSLDQLSISLKEIELNLDRHKQPSIMPCHTIDLDILLFNDVISDNPLLPRKDIFIYPFVLQPLKQLAPDYFIPNTRQTVLELWQEKYHEMDEFRSLKKINLN